MKNTSNSSGQNGNKRQTGSRNTMSREGSDEASGLRELFENELKDIYWAEKALTKAIPKMIKNASSPELIEALTNHLDVTHEHVIRLEEVFDAIDIKAEAKKCDAMDGLMREAAEIMEETKKGVVRDAGIISAGQKVEHYEIATYGTLAAFAKTLNEDEAASLLEETLGEEKEADETLSQIAQDINVEASEEDDDSEEGEHGDVAVKNKRRPLL
jgi:ferritin-like metal-binding protein YciE